MDAECIRLCCSVLPTVYYKLAVTLSPIIRQTPEKKKKMACMIGVNSSHPARYRCLLFDCETYTRSTIAPLLATDTVIRINVNNSCCFPEVTKKRLSP